MAVGKRLKILRNKLNLTQKELAGQIKDTIDYTYIGKIERGEQNPSLKVITRIAESLDISVEYFFSTRPIELYLKSEEKSNKKKEQMVEMLCDLSEEETDFVIGIIDFIKRYKGIKRDKLSKVADKGKKYKGLRAPRKK